jgi:hypothetical protein
MASEEGDMRRVGSGGVRPPQTAAATGVRKKAGGVQVKASSPAKKLAAGLRTETRPDGFEPGLAREGEGGGTRPVLQKLQGKETREDKKILREDQKI